ncbi:MAG: hypothetical protein GAK41_01612 [Burkholderia gladioli]|nr:MAG: hypothetical protein GAK41_01612 [Burkholderia gladioli]
MDIAHDLQSILVQEHTLVFPQLDTARAWALGTRLREMALARSHAVVIEIGGFGLPLFFSPRSTARRPTTPPGSRANAARSSTFAAVRTRSACA